MKFQKLQCKAKIFNMPRSVRPHPLEKTESICYPKAHMKELKQFISPMNEYPYAKNQLRTSTL